MHDAVFMTWAPIAHGLSEALGLTTLPDYLHIIVFAFATCWAIQYASSVISPRVCPVSYNRLTRTGKTDWDIHLVALLHACYATPVSLWLLAGNFPGAEAIRKDKVFGTSVETSYVMAVAVGFMAWDSLVSLWLIRKYGIGFLAHGVGCFIVFLFTFRPFLNYFGAVFLVWEASTIPLNIHWFLDKTSRTGSLWQLINGIVLLITFFSVRLVYGTWQSIVFVKVTHQVRSQIPAGLREVYIVANIVLWGLNIFWFTQMIAALRKRFGSQHKKEPYSVGEDTYSRGKTYTASKRFKVKV
ncbi:uncharacterized protein L969DRAFT_17948 [Mixia osmundae IAM 14324]|uniref:TLC domain-containing protein n=1 Tax=Mixia osmundae (strain CBS 9802 / IAM 14324 / JCM 22182 / KY 12970) TaxID=764103 RepID=G7E0Y7_MIXOS|nr:uncharacterized protein L969DRAFT_17948 [Mixia osmundae IAM 14324]KEI38868.1 hypothetical protein L969DRAFT_17948 [Mixia osmundae IAM 14324]GAA96497.1 hypothetical protein E5Q_03165 [Mixia osmundae IAM 14324]